MPNPFLPGTYPDPSVVRVGADYYLVTSTFEYVPGLPVFHSTDLETWTQLGHAVDRPGQLDLSTVPSSGGLYAPTIRHHDGVFYLVCTLVGGTGRGGHFVLTATDPAGPWSDPAWLDGAAGIDPSLFFDDDGRAWFAATRQSATPEWHDQTDVWLREFDTATLSLVGDEHVLWHGALLGAVWAEGPHIYRRGDWYYLLASEGGTEFDHAVSVARSRAVTGPYTGYAANPVLTHRNLGHGHPITNVGHADLVETPDGGWAAVLLASRGLHSMLGRESFLVPVEWQDDWPVFAPGVGQVVADPARPAPRAAPAPLDWTSPNGPAPATVDGDSVRLAGPGYVGVRQRHVDVGFGARIVGTTDAAGLMVRQSEAARLRLVVTAAATTVVRTAGGVDEVVATAAPASALEIRARGADYECRADGRLIATVDGRFLSSPVAGGFLGVWLGVVSEGDASFSGVYYGD